MGWSYWFCFGLIHFPCINEEIFSNSLLFLSTPMLLFLNNLTTNGEQVKRLFAECDKKIIAIGTTEKMVSVRVS